MSSTHQLPSPPPSERDSPVSLAPILFGKMPLEYVIETDVKPIIRDFKTGAVIDPGGAGDKYVVDRRGKRVPYEVLPDCTPSPMHRARQIKAEQAAYDRLKTADIKSEDEVEGVRILTVGSHNTPQGRHGASRRGVAQSTATARPTIPLPLISWRDRQPQERANPSNDDSSDGSGSSSSENGSSGDESSSDAPSSEEGGDGSVMDVSSVFRPSRSPSRIADTPSPATRSQNRIKQHEEEGSSVASTLSPLSKTQPTFQTTSVPKPPSLSFYIPIRQTDCQSRHNSRLPARPPSPVRAASTNSSATSRVHGWKPINKKKKSKSSRSGQHSEKLPDSTAVRPIPTAPAAMLPSTRHPMPTPQQQRQATAGPSTQPHGPIAHQSPSGHYSQKSNSNDVAQASQSDISAAPRSHTAKGKPISPIIENLARQDNKEQQPDDRSQASKMKDDDENSRSSKQMMNKWQKLRAKKKAKKHKSSDQANPFVRHGPSRQARIERSIEETPRRGLFTPDPSSSAIGNILGPSTLSSTRSESGMFVTSPVQPSSPILSPQEVPRTSLTPMDSSPPSRHGKKRSLSVYENADDAVIGAVANRIFEGFERRVEAMQVEVCRGRERLEQKIENECAERLRSERRLQEQIARDRRENCEEMERFAVGVEEKLSEDRRERKDDQAGLQRARAEHATFIATLQGQLHGQSERVELRLNEQGSRLSTLQGQLDGQRAVNNNSVARLDATIRRLDEVTKYLDELKRRDKDKQVITDRVQRLEAANVPAGRPISQQLPGQTRSSGATRPQVHEVRPREASDWAMRGRPTKAVIPNTLIRSEHGKRNARTLPPCPQRNYGHGGASSSRAAQPVAQSSSDPQSSRHYEGALSHNRSNTSTHSDPPAQTKPHPLPARAGSNTAHSAADHVQPSSSSIPRCAEVAVQPIVPEIQPQPGTPLPPAAPASPLAAAIESTSPPPGRLTHEEMKALVFNQPVSGLNFCIDYDKDLDGGQTSAATAFLLNTPQHHVASRFRDFISRPAFAFDLDDPVNRVKGCWVVHAERQQESQFKLYYDRRNYPFTLNRLAVRLWHGEDSVLRLLLSKDHRAVHLCHNKDCFNPAHIVVESRREHMDRLSCVRGGRCEGHPVWSKCGQIVERKRCILG